MPRTKVPKKPKKGQVSKELSASVDILVQEIEANREKLRTAFTQQFDNFISKVMMHLGEATLAIPTKLLNKTLGELMDAPPNWNGDSTASTIETSVAQMLSSTSQLSHPLKQTSKKHRNKRSSSVENDDGYLTTESTGSTSGSRQSRARSRLTSQTRSRSASTNLTTTTKKNSRYKTPAHRQIPPASYGTVTPKVAPNTPQVLLRRPKNGEMALSLQGSPLLTGNIVTEEMANVNIPLDDGRVLSIQPMRGLRMSQVPALDPETKRQLEALRDNLNKVCAMTSSRR